MSWGASNNQPGAWLCTESGHRVELRPNRVYLFGRDESCDLRIDDPSCSRRQARLSVSGDLRSLSLEDLKSKNGTFHNGKPLKKPVQLKSGDKIQVGATEYVVLISSGEIEVHHETRTTLLDNE